MRTLSLALTQQEFDEEIKSIISKFANHKKTDAYVCWILDLLEESVQYKNILVACDSLKYVKNFAVRLLNSPIQDWENSSAISIDDANKTKKPLLELIEAFNNLLVDERFTKTAIAPLYAIHCKNINPQQEYYNKTLSFKQSIHDIHQQCLLNMQDQQISILEGYLDKELKFLNKFSPDTLMIAYDNFEAVYRNIVKSINETSTLEYKQFVASLKQILDDYDYSVHEMLTSYALMVNSQDKNPNKTTFTAPVKTTRAPVKATSTASGGITGFFSTLFSSTEQDTTTETTKLNKKNQALDQELTREKNINLQLQDTLNKTQYDLNLTQAALENSRLENSRYMENSQINTSQYSMFGNPLNQSFRKDDKTIFHTTINPKRAYCVWQLCNLIQQYSDKEHKNHRDNLRNLINELLKKSQNTDVIIEKFAQKNPIVKFMLASLAEGNVNCEDTNALLSKDDLQVLKTELSNLNKKHTGIGFLGKIIQKMDSKTSSVEAHNISKAL